LEADGSSFEEVVGNWKDEDGPGEDEVKGKL
jgi:hypothetical protein